MYKHAIKILNIKNNNLKKSIHICFRYTYVGVLSMTILICNKTYLMKCTGIRR